MPNLTLVTATKGTITVPQGARLLGIRNGSGATMYYRLGDVSITADAHASTGGLQLLDGEERWFGAAHGLALPPKFSFIQGSGSDKVLNYEVF